MAKKKIHFLYGCPYADGSIQMSDTDQRRDWNEVTCKSCLMLKFHGYGERRRKDDWLLNEMKKKKS